MAWSIWYLALASPLTVPYGTRGCGGPQGSHTVHVGKGVFSMQVTDVLSWGTIDAPTGLESVYGGIRYETPPPYVYMGGGGCFLALSYRIYPRICLPQYPYTVGRG